MKPKRDKYFVVVDTGKGILVDTHQSKLQANAAILILGEPYTILFVSCGLALDGSKRLRLTNRPDISGQEIE